MLEFWEQADALVWAPMAAILLAAGIYLATLARRRGGGEADRMRMASGRGRYVAAYLRSELGQGLANEDLTFLTRTAILEQVTPEAAEAIVELPRAAERLERLAHGNLLIEEVGREGSVYRYHNLLRDFLVAELERREPGSMPSLEKPWQARLIRHRAHDPGSISCP